MSKSLAALITLLVVGTLGAGTALQFLEHFTRAMSRLP